MSIKEKAGFGSGVYVSVCAGKPEAMVSLGNIRAVPESKENIKTDFFIVSPRDKVRTEARSGQTGRKKKRIYV